MNTLKYILLFIGVIFISMLPAVAMLAGGVYIVKLVWAN
jgi:hypothetical protein